MSINTTGFMTVVGILAAIALTVLAFIFIIPEKKREGLGKLFQFIHDILNFKTLFIEKIMKALYTLCTAACIAIGACWLFGFEIYESSYFGMRFNWMGGYGLLLMIVGPIVIRLVYEGIMMFILLVKNTIQINNKLSEKKDEE